MMCRETAGQFFGRSVIEDLIPRQRAYNGCLNRIHEYIKRIAIQGFYAEEGSIDIEEFEQNGAAPGAMLVYKCTYTYSEWQFTVRNNDGTLQSEK